MQSQMLDFRGYFHMDELTRKTARELHLMGFVVSAVLPAVLRSSIGTKVGTWSASLAGVREAYVTCAGAVQKLLGERPFGGTITGTITVQFSGEGYEDFRRKVGIPFFTTATAWIAGRTDVALDYRTADPKTVQSLQSKIHRYSDHYHYDLARMQEFVAATVQQLTAKMRTSSFSKECGYCKSMFIGEGGCPYCGAPAGSAPPDSIVADRSPL